MVTLLIWDDVLVVVLFIYLRSCKNAAVLALGATSNPTGNFCIPKDVFETSKEADEVGAVRPSTNGFPLSSPR